MDAQTLTTLGPIAIMSRERAVPGATMADRLACFQPAVDKGDVYVLTALGQILQFQPGTGFRLTSDGLVRVSDADGEVRGWFHAVTFEAIGHDRVELEEHMDAGARGRLLH